MPRKKQIRNGYYFVMIEHKRIAEENGRFISLNMAAEEIKTAWSKLDQVEKEYFNKMADKFKFEQSMGNHNSFETPFPSIDKTQREKEHEENVMTKWIEDEIRHLDINKMTNEFHLIHINYYCETDAQNFIPAEIAIVKFNCENGIVDTFHTFINPGELPLGYRYMATEYLSRSHGIPLDWDKGETDLNKILAMIKRFLQSVVNQDEYPPLYTMPDDALTNSSISAVKNVLYQLCVNSGDDPDIFKVFLLPKLFFELRNFCKPLFPTQSVAEMELNKDFFKHSKGTACWFHETHSMEFCSLYVVKRWVFTVIDHCCKDLDIKLVPGKHYPVGVDVLEGKYEKVTQPDKENFCCQDEKKSPFQTNVKPITIINEEKLQIPFIGRLSHATTGDNPLQSNTIKLAGRGRGRGRGRGKLGQPVLNL